MTLDVPPAKILDTCLMKPILMEQAKPFFSGAMVFAEIAGTNWLKLSSNTLLIMAPEYRYRPLSEFGMLWKER
jgi:hypothetical protein